MAPSIVPFAVGSKSRALCEACGGVVPTTFVQRDVPFSDGIGVALGVLVAVCDGCNAVVAIPAQEGPALAVARAAALAMDQP